MTSHPDWGTRTKATEAATAFSAQIKNRYGPSALPSPSPTTVLPTTNPNSPQPTVLITGLTRNSLGEAAALAIAAQGPALLILASRTPANLDYVAREIASVRPSTAVATVQLDLLSQASVRRAAGAIRRLAPRLDVLVNNAGVMTRARRTSPEGVEAQFAINHVGPFLLTNLLVGLLVAAAEARGGTEGEGGEGGVMQASPRVVNVSSLGLRLSPVRFHDYNVEGREVPPEERGPPDDKLPKQFVSEVDGYRGFTAYGQSKTANVLFAVALTQRLKSRGVVAYGLHPGSIWTNLSRDLDEEGNAAIAGTAKDWKSPDEGASTVIVAAFDPALNEPSGSFLSDCQFYEPPPYATDPEIADRLWSLSEDLVKEKFDLSSKL
ncbi:Short-chain dehydrogenase TIC 32, chloroplastic [Diplodia seriata]|uniref:Short-chain dehydrogenase TIC 32, chloroplastic n=1 Tax=Diplodia seriata TaxID=420778 RepID=A0A1S8BK72_9PEZI|nr:Short-chain dehydrogenase TIC 32, chloroplastic [Diplodia seriata]